MDGWMTFWFYDVDTVLTIELTIPQLLLSFCVWIWLWSPSTLWIACWFWELLNIFFARACSALSLLFLFLFLPPFLAQKGTISSSCFIESNCDQWWRFVQVLRQRTCVHKYMLNTCNYIYIYAQLCCITYLFTRISCIYACLIWILHLPFESCAVAFHIGVRYWVETCHMIFILEVLNGEVTIMVGLRMRLENWFRSWQWSHQRHGKLKVMRKQLIQMFEVGDDCGWFREGSRWF